MTTNSSSEAELSFTTYTHRQGEQEAKFISDLKEGGGGGGGGGGIILLAREKGGDKAGLGEIVGSAAAVSKGRRSAHVFAVSVVVRRDRWRKGIGSRLMRRIEEKVRSEKRRESCLVG